MMVLKAVNPAATLTRSRDNSVDHKWENAKAHPEGEKFILIAPEAFVKGLVTPSSDGDDDDDDSSSKGSKDYASFKYITATESEATIPRKVRITVTKSKETAKKITDVPFPISLSTSQAIVGLPLGRAQRKERPFQKVFKEDHYSRIEAMVLPFGVEGLLLVFFSDYCFFRHGDVLDKAKGHKFIKEDCEFCIVKEHGEKVTVEIKFQAVQAEN